ncbi:hypothetical protein H2203_001449 [Taxawa tesnikishii (nom. ined.)]|nr:hypothetical protein H2203_001449 [Dothideales sp. JES 119]
MYNQYQNPAYDEEMDDDDQDFYGEDETETKIQPTNQQPQSKPQLEQAGPQTKAGQPVNNTMAPTPSIPASATAALGKAPNAMGTPEARAQKLADMRAFLLAKKRSNTPAKFADVKAEATSRPQTPSQLPHKPQVAASQHPPPKEKRKRKRRRLPQTVRTRVVM